MTNTQAWTLDLNDEKTVYIAKCMSNDQRWAYGLLDETKSDQLWEDLSCHPIFSPKPSGQLLKACWEQKVDSVYKKQFLIMRAGKGNLSLIEQQVLSAIVEREIDMNNPTQNIDEPIEIAVSGKRSADYNQSEPKRLKKIEFKKQGLQAMYDGNSHLESLLTTVIRLSNSRNRVVSIGMDEAINNVETLCEQIDEFAKKQKRM